MFVDVAMMEEFVDEVKVPTFGSIITTSKDGWIIEESKYFNPQLKGKTFRLLVRSVSCGVEVEGLACRFRFVRVVRSRTRRVQEKFSDSFRVTEDSLRRLYNSKLGKLIELFSFALKARRVL